MKATGIVRKVDDLGRVVLPMEIRRNLGIGISDPLEIFVVKGAIVLKRYDAEDDLLTMANRLKEKVAAEHCGKMKPILMNKLAEIEKIILSGTDKK